ncbi:MRG-domain-containing protein [Guyanagaster necrorhizus]|uniref:Chromatin modification-related protein EAF3 n=1 Tax=Guyanagaster necrorhizus TaxID=856835 RepID=A0A9P7VJ69_9AGAR|nr:MRG-domain-containing protein [Guyanagaster necrorhizus MCA 3950]KAG7442111.1 MRG-domain-containing protein [Guyanagaster necrorhizus MCA 3950]
MASDPSSSQAGTFEIGERILCYHGPLIYEAKVLEAQNMESPAFSGIHYLVHYKGWKRTWDEWVPLGRALPYTEENLAKQKALQKTNTPANQTAATKTKTRETAGPSRTARKDGTRGTKRGRDDDEGTRKPEMKLTVPESLKATLVDDWEAVTKNNQLVDLPRNPNVVQILALFAKYVLETRPAELRQPEILIHTIISGLQVYFDRSLGSQLLYRFERPQYAVVRQTYVTGADVDVSKIPEMSAIYGAEHLLRMLVSLPQMVSASPLDAESVGLIRDYVNELLNYLAANKATLFLLEYQPASLQYQNVSRS